MSERPILGRFGHKSAAVYRCGFATSQQPYEEAFRQLFGALDRVEALLSARRYLSSAAQLSLADVRLFTTLIRFDTVYHSHFKCNRKKIKEFPNTYAFLCAVTAMPVAHGRALRM